MPGKSVGVSARCSWRPRTIAVLVTILGAALMVLRPAIASAAPGYDDQIKQISAQLADAISNSGKKTVAVSAFTDLDGNVTEFGRFLAGDLADSLAAQGKGFLVIDRTQPNGMQQSSIVDAMVIGSVTPFSDHVRLSTKLLDATSSAILGAATVDIPRTKDIDDLLAESGPAAMKSGNTHAAASSSAPTSPTASNDARSSATNSAAPSAKPAKAPRAVKAPKPAGAAATPTVTGMGSAETDSYRVVATSLTHSAANVSVTLEFDAVSQNTVELAMLPSQTYLTDESGLRWALAHTDTAAIFNVRGGFWRGVPLAKGAKIQTVLTFSPQGPATGTKFTLTISEFRPKWNRVVAIQGLK